jgi:hypothetical protein
MIEEEFQKRIVNDMETEQLRLGVVMTTADEKDSGNRSPNLNDILAKIGTVSYFESKE